MPGGFEIGDTVAVIGQVHRLIEADGEIPAGVQIRFTSHAQPDRGASYVPVPLKIVRKTDEEIG